LYPCAKGNLVIKSAGICTQGFSGIEFGINFPTGVMLQANFPQKITFDTLYTNRFSIKIRSRTLSIPSEYNTIQ